MIVEHLFSTSTLIGLIAGMVTWLTIRLVVFFFHIRKVHKTLKKYSIPGPKFIIFGGNYFDIKLEDEYDIHVKWAKEHGKVYGYYIGDQVHIHISELDILKAVFFENNDVFKDRMDTLLHISPLVDGILFAPHARWKPMRKFLTPAFNFYGSNAVNTTEFIELTVDHLIQYLNTKCQDADDRKTIKNLDIHDLMKSMALFLINSMAIGLEGLKVELGSKHVKSLDEFLHRSDKGIIDLAAVFPIFEHILAFMSMRFELESVMHSIHTEVQKEMNHGIDYLNGKRQDDARLAAIYKKEQPKSIIHRMIKLHHEGKITDVEFMGNVYAFLFAGYDTTSTTMTYFFWSVAKHQDIQDKLRLDLMRHGTDSQYLTQVLNETMRLYPTVGTFTKRKANCDITIKGWTFPKGCTISHNTEVLHHDPDYWTEPYKFDPERFREGVEIHPCAFAPFGLGERRCLGYKLAISEMKLSACSVLLKYRIKLVKPQELKRVRCANVLTKPAEKVLLDLEAIDAK